MQRRLLRRLPQNKNPEGTRCIQFAIPDDDEWERQAFSQLSELGQWMLWERDEGKNGTVVARQWRDALQTWQACDYELPTEGDCSDYGPDALFISWEPGNPFTEPHKVPNGYVLPPWYVVGIDIPFTGLKPGDVITDGLHFPFNTLASGLPRFRVNVTGKGTIELHFLRFPTAGIALITTDGNPTSTKWTNLDVSFETDDGEIDPVSITEIEIVTPGEHFVDVTMIAYLSTEPPFFHGGGGLRKVSLCGFDQDKPTGIIEELPYEMTICEQLRWHDGKLQGLCCGEWQDIAGQDGGIIPGGIVQPGGDGRPGAGQCKKYKVLLNANNVWQLPFPVVNGDIITITNIQGIWSDGTILWKCPDGTPYVLGQCIGARGHVTGDPSSTQYHMQLIAQVASQFYSCTDGPFTLSGGSGSQSLTIQANDEILPDNRGSLSFDLEWCSGATPPPTEWCFIMDFTQSDYDFVADVVSSCAEGLWVSESGWETGDCLDILDRRIVTISLACTAHITEITMIYDYTIGTGSSSQLGASVGVEGCTATTLQQDEMSTGDNQILTVNPDCAGTAIRLTLQPSVGEYSGAANIKRLVVSGKDTNPFGINNC